MSHSVALKVSEDLKSDFAEACQENSVRMFKVKIVDECFNIVDRVEMAAVPTVDSADAFQKTLTSVMAEGEAALLIYNDVEHTKKFILIRYVPDKVHIRERMLYASAGNQLKSTLHVSQFAGELHYTGDNDVDFQDVIDLSEHQTAKKEVDTSAMTESELAQHEQSYAVREATEGTTNVHGVAFPLSDAAKTALTDYKSASRASVALTIDSTTENITTVAFEDSNADGIGQALPKNVPSYVFVRVTNPAKDETVTAFVYVCPTQTPVKLRMMAATAKGAALKQAEDLGIEVARRLECSDVDECTGSWMRAECFPEASSNAKGGTSGASAAMKFKKPSRPGRGPRRL